ncbi:MAG: LCP family protein [Emergencia sp.]
MRSDKHRQKEKNAFKTFTRFWAVLYFLASAAFLGVLIYMDLLPVRYLCIAAGVIALLLLLFFPALYSRRFRKSRKILCLILSFAVMTLYGVGIAYMSGTMDFFTKITEGSGVETEEFDVVVRKDSAYEDETALKGQKVQTPLNNDLSYSEARNRLKEELGVEYEVIENLSELADNLTGGAADSIFVSAASYTTMCDEHAGFEEDTRILYKIRIEKPSEDIAKKVDVTSEPFNIYISGLDTEGTIDIVSRSDVNMIVTVNPQTHNILLTSLPRDAYISLVSRGGAGDKLTHTGLYGISETVAAAENLMGIDINYYAKVNYTTVTDLVDAIGGIDIVSDYTFVTHGMGVYYEFYEGENHLDGARALAFARERKSFSDGDFQRNRNQQIVLEGILKKAMSSTTILTKYTTILNAVEDSVELNMSRSDIQKLIKMQLDGMPSWNIEKQSVTGTADSDLCYSTGDYYVSVVTVDPASVMEALDRIVAVMEGKNE